MLTHDNVVASIESFHRIVPPMEHRIVSLLPLSHLLEQAVGLYYALDVGADILYVRSRNPRVIFDALRDHRVTSMVVVPQVLDLFWSAIEREVEKRGRTKRVRPAPVGRPPPPDAVPPAALRERPRPARRPLPPVPVVRGVPPAGAPAGLGGPRRHGPAGLRRHRDGHRDLHDARRPRAGHGRARPRGHRDADRRRRRDPVPRPDRVQRLLERPRGDRGGVHRRRLVPDRRHRPSRRRGPAHPVRPEQGHDRAAQRLQRVSRGHRERPAGRRDPRRRRGRDEARPDRGHRPGRQRQSGRCDRRGGPRSRGGDPAEIRARLDAAVKAANATLGPNQRIAGWRLWPEDDFPRTHTLKIKRGPIRAWAAVEGGGSATGR